MEPVGAVPEDVLRQAIADSAQTPNHGYLHATLEVGVDKMADFTAAVAQAYQSLPIIACWRPIGGSPNEVLDIWKSPEPTKAYQPADDWRREFMRGVRVAAPKERAIRMLALPYSPLRQDDTGVSTAGFKKEGIIRWKWVYYSLVPIF